MRLYNNEEEERTTRHETSEISKAKLFREKKKKKKSPEDAHRRYSPDQEMDRIRIPTGRNNRDRLSFLPYSYDKQRGLRGTENTAPRSRETRV